MDRMDLNGTSRTGEGGVGSSRLGNRMIAGEEKNSICTGREQWLHKRGAMSMFQSLGPVNVIFGKEVCAEAINLRILRRDHHGLSVWALNLMTSFLLKERQRERFETEEKTWRRRGKVAIKAETR